MALVAIGQLCSTGSIASNLKVCEGLVQNAAAAGAKALFLPEASDYIARDAAESYELAKTAGCRNFVTGLQCAARQYKIGISVGVHEPGQSSGKVKNMQIWIDTQGQVAHTYQKIHLFDVKVEGGPIIEESKGTEKGITLTDPFQTDLGTLGMLICFDLRFPEVSLALRRKGAEIITYPSAFAVLTGRAHWRPLLQARAIETQTYVIAAAQSGPHNEKRTSYGRSMIVDPWGKILVELDDSPDPQIGLAIIDLARLKDIRCEMPLARQFHAYPEI